MAERVTSLATMVEIAYLVTRLVEQYTEYKKKPTGDQKMVGMFVGMAIEHATAYMEACKAQNDGVARAHIQCITVCVNTATKYKQGQTTIEKIMDLLFNR